MLTQDPLCDMFRIIWLHQCWEQLNFGVMWKLCLKANISAVPLQGFNKSVISANIKDTVISAIILHIISTYSNSTHVSTPAKNSNICRKTKWLEVLHLNNKLPKVSSVPFSTKVLVFAALYYQLSQQKPIKGKNIPALGCRPAPLSLISLEFPPAVIPGIRGHSLAMGELWTLAPWSRTALASVFNHLSAGCTCFDYRH